MNREILRLVLLVRLKYRNRQQHFEWISASTPGTMLNVLQFPVFSIFFFFFLLLFNDAIFMIWDDVGSKKSAFNFHFELRVCAEDILNHQQLIAHNLRLLVINIWRSSSYHYYLFQSRSDARIKVLSPFESLILMKFLRFKLRHWRASLLWGLKCATLT